MANAGDGGGHADPSNFLAPCERPRADFGDRLWDVDRLQADATFEERIAYRAYCRQPDVGEPGAVRERLNTRIGHKIGLQAPVSIQQARAFSGA